MNSSGAPPTASNDAAAGTRAAHTRSVRRTILWAIAAVAAAVAIALIVWLSGGRGFNSAEVPNVLGTTERYASEVLAGSGLRAGTLTRTHSEEDAGTIIGQSPRAGSQAKRGETVDLVISSGPEAASVPTLIGLSEADAMSALSAAGLSGTVVSSEYNEDFEPGRIVRQSPAPGEVVEGGQPVSMVTSTRSRAARTAAPGAGADGRSGAPDGGDTEIVRVPAVFGLARLQAERMLRQAGFSVTVTESNSTTVKAGTVFDQLPKAGTEVVAGTTVRITVSVGHAQVAVPDVVGMSASVAKSKIAAAGLRAMVVYEPSRGTDDVVAQSPKPGTRISDGGIVTITVDGRPE